MNEHKQVKACSICKQEKPIIMFGKSTRIKDGYRGQCKECRSKTEKSASSEYKHNWYLNHKDECTKRNSEWIKNNPERSKEIKSKWSKANANKLYHIRKFDIDYKIKLTWRNLLRRTMTNKTDSTLNLLGYTSEQLRKHIENQFLTGMTWDNYGSEWAIDHIIPVSYYDTTTPASVVNALKNLRPLWNISRSVNIGGLNVLITGNLNRKNNVSKEQQIKDIETFNLPGTLITDLDGCLLKHHGSLDLQISEDPELLPFVLEKLNELILKDWIIVIATGRPEKFRDITVEQLKKVRIPYHNLIMGIGQGQRVLVNDYKVNSDIPTSRAFNPPRNEGLEHLFLIQ